MRLIYVKADYAFITYFDESELKQLETRSLLGQVSITMKNQPVLIVNPDTPMLEATHYIYQLPSGKHIRMEVPIAPDVMSWVTPTVTNMCVIIRIY